MLIIRIDSGAIPAVFGLLFMAGFAYNLLVSWLERRHYDEGYTALLVVAGVGMTLLGIGLLDGTMMLIALGAFATSGFWMVLGSIWRHVRIRERSVKAILDETKGLAE